MFKLCSCYVVLSPRSHRYLSSSLSSLTTTAKTRNSPSPYLSSNLTQSNPMRLPIEVSEAVIDEASDDTASLCDLSLTCAAFLPRSRFHLWGSIVVRDVKRMVSSCDFFDEHPWLVPLVNKVTLFPKSLPQEYHSKRNIRPLDMVPVHLLTRLPNLRSWAMAAPLDLTLSRREPSLSLPHRTTLAVYRRYSSRIQSLDLSEIRFYCLSDFTGLLAAFTAVQTLSCASIQFRREPEEELDVSLYVGRTGMLSRPSRVSTLTVSLRSTL